MPLWGLLPLAVLVPSAPAGAGPSLVLALVLLTAAVLVAARVALPAAASGTAPAVRAFARRARTSAPPRLLDPDAAGRPRPRAPSGRFAAA